VSWSCWLAYGSAHIRSKASISSAHVELIGLKVHMSYGKLVGSWGLAQHHCARRLFPRLHLRTLSFFLFSRLVGWAMEADIPIGHVE
jgi:hypothetical protein